VGKPAVSTFCKDFSVILAAGRRGRRSVVTRALSKALAAGDRVLAAQCRVVLAEIDAELAAGAAVRAHLPLADEEVPAAVHAAQEARFGPAAGLHAVKTADGAILDAPADVEREVSAYFEALFHGRHVAAAGAAEPLDGGRRFVPDDQLVGELLEGLPAISSEDASHLERPFTLQELQLAVESAAAAKSPGRDGLSYEFYAATFPLVGPALLDGLNAMLEGGLLAASMRRGVVRLLPKVPGTPTAAQLRPITLLCTDYKLLTKMMVGRLLPLLPEVVVSNQLCSVRGRSVFEGPAAVLSASAFLQHHHRPGFLLSLDFFHAYDRVSMEWLDAVLAAMGFGGVFRGWIATLHRDISSSFLLHAISRPLQILFSIRQGDPLSSLLFVIYVEPFLRRLAAVLTGMRLAGLRDWGFGYMDDVEVVSNDIADLPRVDDLCRRFEAAAGAILNRNRKTVVLGLGSWAGREEWPLPWLHHAPVVKVLGFSFSASVAASLDATWERVTAGITKTLNMWSGRHLPTLLQRVQVLETFVLSKAWYFCQVFPLPPAWASRLRSAVSTFLWRGRPERLAFDELHRPPHQGGLGLSCIQSRAEALLTKQFLHFIAADGGLAVQLSFWLGPPLRLCVPQLPVVRQAPDRPLPEVFQFLLPLLLEALALPGVNAAGLEAVSSKSLYKAWTADLPYPKVEYRRPDLAWHLTWTRLASHGDSFERDFFFSLLHNILPVPSRRHRLRLDPSAVCGACGAPHADIDHCFFFCPRVAAAWGLLVHRCNMVAPALLGDEEILFLAWPPAAEELGMVSAVITFASWVWETREDPAPLDPAVLALRAREAAATAAAAGQPFRHIFL